MWWWLCQAGARYNNDVAVLRFPPSSQAQMVAACRPGLVWPACWPRHHTDYSYWTDSWAVGWGRTQPAISSISTVLQETQLVPVSWDKCRDLMGEARITPGMICAVAPNTDTCNVRREERGERDIMSCTAGGQRRTTLHPALRHGLLSDRYHQLG